MKNFYTNVRTNKQELSPEFWSVRSLFKVLRTLSLSLSLSLTATNRTCYVGTKNKDM